MDDRDRLVGVRGEVILFVDRFLRQLFDETLQGDDRFDLNDIADVHGA